MYKKCMLLLVLVNILALWAVGDFTNVNFSSVTSLQAYLQVDLPQQTTDTSISLDFH